MSKLRVAIVGCGGMASVHASRFAHVLDKVAVTAAVDVDMAKASATAEMFDNCRAVRFYQEIIDECDAALIALPHHLHYQTGLDFLFAGKHVLMEKPLANTEAECLDLIEAANKNNVVLMTAYCMRFHPQFIQLKQLLDEKKYGDVFQLSIWTEQHTQRTDPGQYNWMQRQAGLGGGQFFSHGCHYVDLLLWYLGRPQSGIHLGTNYGTPWMQCEGTSNASFVFENGPLAYHFGTWGAKGTRLGYSVHAHCTEGMLEIQLQEGRLSFYHKDKVEVLAEKAQNEHAGNKYVHLEIEHFVDCVRNGLTPITNAPQSLQSLRVIWRLYQAEQQGVLADLRGLGFDQVDSDGRLITTV